MMDFRSFVLLVAGLACLCVDAGARVEQHLNRFDELFFGPVTAARDTLAELDAGQTTLFAGGVSDVAEIPERELKRKLSWRDGLLSYGGEPLDAVVSDVSRYTDIRIEIGDAALADRRVAGYFRIDDIEGSLDSLAMSFGLAVEHVSPKHIRITDAS